MSETGLFDIRGLMSETGLSVLWNLMSETGLFDIRGLMSETGLSVLWNLMSETGLFDIWGLMSETGLCLMGLNVRDRAVLYVRQDCLSYAA